MNTSTVSQAYREAVRRHLVSGEVGRGTYVPAGGREAGLFALKAGTETGPALIDLSTNVPALDPDSPDLLDTLAALGKESAIGAAAMSYHAPALLAQARLAGATWLAVRGLHLRPADVVPCASAQSALLAVLLALSGAMTRSGNRLGGSMPPASAFMALARSGTNWGSPHDLSKTAR